MGWWEGLAEERLTEGILRAVVLHLVLGAPQSSSLEAPTTKKKIAVGAGAFMHWLCLEEVRKRVLERGGWWPNRRPWSQTGLWLHTWTKCLCEERAITNRCSVLGFQIQNSEKCMLALKPSYSICSNTWTEHDCQHRQTSEMCTGLGESFFIFCMPGEIKSRVSQIRHAVYCHTCLISPTEFKGSL